MNDRLTLRTILHDYFVVLLAPLLLLGPILARGQALFWGTPSLQFVPWWVYAWNCLRQGALPLWNPLNGMGAPLLANYQVAFFYPPNWILLALAALGGPNNAAAAVAWGYTFLAMLHLAWGGLGMSLLIRRLTFPWLGQVVGGLVFGLSGYVVARLGFFSMVWVAAWLPWVIFFVESIAGMGAQTERPGQGKVVLLPGLVVCVAMQLLAGHAQLTWYTLLLAFAWVSGGMFRSRKALRAGGIRRAIWAWLSLGAAVGLGTGLAAVQLVPTAEYLLLSHRASAVAYEEAATYSFWPWRFLTLFSPDFFGNPAQGNFWGYASYWEDHLYMGMLPLILALATFWLVLKGLRREKRPKRWGLIVFAWLLCAAAFVLALGKNSPVFPFLYWHIPTFSMFQAPARYLVWVAFAIPILAAAGMEHWRCPTGRGLYWLRLGTAGAFAITLGAGLAGIFLQNVQLTFIRATALTGMWSLGFGLLTLVLPSYQQRDLPLIYMNKMGRYRIWQWAVVGWTLADLLVTGWSLNPGVGVDFYVGRSPALEQLQGSAAGQRVYLSPGEEYDLKFTRFLRFKDFSALEDWRGLRSALIPNLNLLDGVPSANNFDPLVPGSYARWMEEIGMLAPDVQKAWLSWMGVGAVEHIDVSHPGGVRYDSISGAQRLHWYACRRTASDEQDAWSQVQQELSAPPRGDRAVFLEDAAAVSAAAQAPAAVPSGPCSSTSTADVRILSERPDRVIMEVNATGSGWLELMDTWYPGWTASVDGRKAPLYRADGLFRAVPVGSGAHKVIVNYRPSGFYFAAMFSILVLLFVLYLLPRWGRKSVG